MVSDSGMDHVARLFVDALRSGIRGERVSWAESLDAHTQNALIRLAHTQALLPLFAQAVYESPAMSRGSLAYLKKEAKRLTVGHAARTAEFLLLYDALAERGLRPAVLKGLVCRSLYPNPELRPSTDEDLLVAPEAFSAYHTALLDYGLLLAEPDAPLDGADEVAYRDDSRGMYLELHLRPFPAGSEAYGDCNRLFDEALSRCEELEIYGRPVRTLGPTDHLLYLLCHAYKHILHGGVGIRQLCDICLFAERFSERIDWGRLFDGCRVQHLEILTAAVFRIGEKHLGIPAPERFQEIETDELPLLNDCLTGGVYGADDADRLHSSTLTLEAVAASRSGRRPRTALHSLFLPANQLEGRYPYLRKRPWLLPAAWVQRIWNYAAREKTKPGQTLRAGQERLALLKHYQVLP